MHKKFMRRVIFLLTAVLMISCGSLVYAGTVESSGTCGENATWTLDSEGVLTISGNGQMGAFDSAFRSYKVKKVIIEEGITSIVNEAFKGGYDIVSVSLPDTIISIGDYAFAECTGLSSIILPNKVTSIGSFCFYECSSLTSFVIPDSVTSIGYSVFRKCSNLRTFTIPDGVTSIDSYEFEGCSNLTSIIIPDSVTSIGGCAFEGCRNLTSIVIPNRVTSIGYSAFNGCSSLTSIILPDSVTSVGNIAFYYCNNLTSITIPGSVNSIGDSAFAGCNNIIIYGVANSNVHEYAKTNDINFKCISHQNIVAVPPKAATCISTGLTEGKKCEDCGTIVEGCTELPTIDHEPFTEVETKGNLLYNGIIVSKCACGKIFSKSVIPKASEVKMEKDSFVYDGTTKTPVFIIKDCYENNIDSNNYEITGPTEALDVGRYTYTITFKNLYTGTKTLYLTIKPETTTIQEIQPLHNRLKVYWNPVLTETTGYEIMGASKDSFDGDDVKRYSAKGSEESSIIMHCTNPCTTYDGIYYVKIRTYKTVGGLKIYSDWSDIMSTSVSWNTHNWDGDEGVVSKEATCKEEGTITYTCISDGCGATKTEPIPVNKDTHPAASITDLPVNAATCTAPGKTAGKFCTTCQTVTVPQLDVAATGHAIVVDATVEATCTTPGLTAGEHCSKCDYKVVQTVIPVLGHKAGELKVTVKATATKEGQKVSKCTACNEVVKTVVISPAKVTLSKAGVNFTGKKVKAPIVRVKTAAGKVIPAKYYTIKAPKNVKKMKDIGRYTYTIKFKANCPEYKGTVKLHFEIKPAKTTIKAPAASKKAITVKWAKGKKAQVTGYDILLATDKKFSKNKKTITVKGVNVTSKKVTKLKAKTKYFVKVRTYKTVKGVKIYSDWSKVKTIRTK